MIRNPEAEQALVKAMSMLEEDDVNRLVVQLHGEGYDHHQIFALLNQGVGQVGTLFEHGDYFLADLIAAGLLYNNILNQMNLFTASSGKPRLGTVLIGVMANDIHDIGKDIVSGLLRVEGFEVIDLGIDVSSERFVTAALQYRPDVIAMCGMLFYSSIEMGRTMDQFERAHVRNFAKIIIGGGCVSQSVCEMVRADAYFTEPLDTLEYCKSIVQTGACHEK